MNLIKAGIPKLLSDDYYSYFTRKFIYSSYYFSYNLFGLKFIQMKILIVEDNRVLARSIERVLKKEGYTVICIWDGEEGEN